MAWIAIPQFSHQNRNQNGRICRFLDRQIAKTDCRRRGSWAAATVKADRRRRREPDPPTRRTHLLPSAQAPRRQGDASRFWPGRSWENDVVAHISCDSACLRGSVDRGRRGTAGPPEHRHLALLVLRLFARTLAILSWQFVRADTAHARAVTARTPHACRSSFPKFQAKRAQLLAAALRRGQQGLQIELTVGYPRLPSRPGAQGAAVRAGSRRREKAGRRAAPRCGTIDGWRMGPDARHVNGRRVRSAQSRRSIRGW